MKKTLLPLAMGFLAGACSGSADVDAQTALPGTWKCDDDIEIVLKPNGRYEWHVVYDDEYLVGVTDNDQLKVTDRGHVILGEWRTTGGRLEMDMLGETDSYALSFRSATAVRLSGPENYGCEKE